MSKSFGILRRDKIIINTRRKIQKIAVNNRKMLSNSSGKGGSGIVLPAVSSTEGSLIKRRNRRIIIRERVDVIKDRFR